MILMDKVGHTVLKKGDVVRSPSGSNDWVVINNEGEKIIAEGLTKVRPGMKVKPIIKQQ